jgi:hypothetical protein
VGNVRLFNHRERNGSLRASAALSRVKPNFSKRFNLILPVQSHLKKFFALPVGQIISTSPRHPVSQEGRLAIVTDVENGMRWTQYARLTSARSCGRRSRVVLTPRCWR